MTEPAPAQFPTTQPRPTTETGSNGRNGYDKRLRALEDTVARIDERTKHLATREDLERTIKNLHKWLSGTLIAALVSIVLVLFRTFLPFP